jgi:hypothetical protein
MTLRDYKNHCDNVDFIMHFGIKGQKWGIRRYQNEDGSLTPEGQQHYGYQSRGSRFKTYTNKRRSKMDRPEANEINRRRIEKQNREIAERGITRKQYNDEQRRKRIIRDRIVLGATGLAMVGANLWAQHEYAKTMRQWNERFR